jgi:hypothetical protein
MQATDIFCDQAAFAPQGGRSFVYRLSSQSSQNSLNNSTIFWQQLLFLSSSSICILSRRSIKAKYRQGGKYITKRINENVCAAALCCRNRLRSITAAAIIPAKDPRYMLPYNFVVSTAKRQANDHDGIIG